ncbi:cytidylyltransferase domain-containing protein [Prochlorococcus sp. MIT 0604]|uniref:acylneuraminate cytidylyltransferase family protein n=1 Tax=Prochlorococcus sp. MIT 0604 TaxID=1501268 RepID=UPI0004F7D966|nr:acylneuraminate cytidylyltransferase family protein [Prochlorococcus sp. MIT 0604]AIQ95461.1 N-Acetylneuraminate cytidylyltransferase [Prochlorococcus sp. MIT 0604]
MKKYIYFIPARGGSKRIKDKNIKLLDDKPLISYSIEFALKVAHKSEIFVSSDSPKINSIASDYGINIHDRSEEFAKDSTSMLDTVIDFIESQKIDKEANLVILQPTTPFREKSFFLELKDLFEKNISSSSALSVVKCNFFHPSKIGKINNLRYLDLLDIEKQDNVDNEKKEAYYVISGSFYIISIKDLLNNLSFIGNNPLALAENASIHCNINEEVDFEIAKFILKNKAF